MTIHVWGVPQSGKSTFVERIQVLLDANLDCYRDVKVQEWPEGVPVVQPSDLSVFVDRDKQNGNIFVSVTRSSMTLLAMKLYPSVSRTRNWSVLVAGFSYILLEAISGFSVEEN